MSKCKGKDFQDEQFDWLDSYDKNIGIKLPKNQPKNGLKFSVYIKNKQSFYEDSKNQNEFCQALFFHIGFSTYFEKSTKKEFYNDFKKEFVWLHSVLTHYSNLSVTSSSFPRWLKRLYMDFLIWSESDKEKKKRKLSEIDQSKVEDLLNYCLGYAYKTDLDKYRITKDNDIDCKGYLTKHVYTNKIGFALYKQHFEGKTPNEIEDLLFNSDEAVFFRNALRKLNVI